VKPHSVKSFDAAAATTTSGGKEPATKTATASKKK